MASSNRNVFSDIETNGNALSQPDGLLTDLPPDLIFFAKRQREIEASQPYLIQKFVRESDLLVYGLVSELVIQRLAGVPLQFAGAPTAQELMSIIAKIGLGREVHRLMRILTTDPRYFINTIHHYRKNHWSKFVKDAGKTVLPFLGGMLATSYSYAAINNYAVDQYDKIMSSEDLDLDGLQNALNSPIIRLYLIFGMPLAAHSILAGVSRCVEGVTWLVADKIIRTPSIESSEADYGRWVSWLKGIGNVGWDVVSAITLMKIMEIGYETFGPAGENNPVNEASFPFYQLLFCISWMLMNYFSFEKRPLDQLITDADEQKIVVLDDQGLTPPPTVSPTNCGKAKAFATHTIPRAIGFSTAIPLVMIANQHLLKLLADGNAKNFSEPAHLAYLGGMYAGVVLYMKGVVAAGNALIKRLLSLFPSQQRQVDTSIYADDDNTQRIVKTITPLP